MIFDWYKIFNLTEWLEEGLVSRKLSVSLDGKGETELLICQGNETSIQVDDVFLPINFGGKNPWSFSGYGVYLDENNDVWLGFEVEE